MKNKMNKKYSMEYRKVDFLKDDILPLLPKDTTRKEEDDLIRAFIEFEHKFDKYKSTKINPQKFPLIKSVARRLCIINKMDIMPIPYEDFDKFFDEVWFDF